MHSASLKSLIQFAKIMKGISLTKTIFELSQQATAYSSNFQVLNHLSVFNNIIQ